MCEAPLRKDEVSRNYALKSVIEDLKKLNERSNSLLA